jgi:formylglycine-generating enzyme required for sulfatase activity
MSTESPTSADARLTARPTFPYPGLRPFEASEWSIFFGREAMIDEIIDRLAAHRLVLIHGSSGAGKSSLVRAGVLPKLERQHRLAGMAWQTCAMRPTGGPLWNLAKEFARLGGDGEDASRIGRMVGEFSRRGATISSVAASLESLNGRHLCILVDQFEELFRFEKETSREEAELFVDLLVQNDVEVAEDAGEGSKSDGRATTVHIVVTMRSEFLGECARFNGLAEAINRTQYLVPRMERDALLRAIRRPAQLYNGTVTLDLAERLIADAAGREDELPLIQHGLMLMWHDAAAKVQPNGKTSLDAVQLEAAGGLKRMLSAQADAVVEGVAPDAERRRAVERLFRALTDVNVEGKAIRRPQRFRDLVAVTGIGAELLRAIVDALRRDGVSFLTPHPPEPIAEMTPIDISHEALIRCWDRLSDPLNGWLKREFDAGLAWRSLLVEARSFERDKRRVLSPATTMERLAWWRDQPLNPQWAERYGGNFGLVDRLLVASRHNARRQRLLQYAFISLLLCISAAGAGYAGWSNWVRLQLWSDVHLGHTVLSSSQERALKPADRFRECTRCPEMTVVPAGSFAMGPAVSPGDRKDVPATETPVAESERGRSAGEDQQRPVEIARSFAVGRFEVTFDDWDACYEDGGCYIRPFDRGWGRGNRPVILVSWDDAKKYVAWLSQVTGKPYRLLSEAEYEYAARAGTTSTYPWGDNIRPNGTAMANCRGCGSRWGGEQTAPVGSFASNKFGLYDMVGNVWEWTEDCYHNSYNDAPADGSALPKAGGENCTARAVRGGSWDLSSEAVRSASRSGFATANQDLDHGFRVARTLASAAVP